MIRTLIVAAASELRDRHLAAIDAHGDVEIVGTAADVATALAIAKDSRPDVIVLGEVTAREGRVAEIRSFRDAVGSAAVIVLGAAIDLPHVERCAKAGAAGYVLDDAPKELVAAIRSAALGGIWLSPRIGAQLIQDERRRLGSLVARDASDPAPLRARQLLMP